MEQETERHSANPSACQRSHPQLCDGLHSLKHLSVFSVPQDLLKCIPALNMHGHSLTTVHMHAES
jgi:hypothetical protein